MGEWFSTISTEIPGIARKDKVQSRDLRAGVFVWIAPSTHAFVEAFGSLASKLSGIVVTVGERSSCSQLYESIWHRTVTPDELGTIAQCLAPWVACLEQLRMDQRGTQKLTIELERATADRERLEVALRHAEHQAHVVLEHAGDALILVDLDGQCDEAASSLAFQWFGSPKGKRVWDYLCADATGLGDLIMLGFEALRDAFLPPEVVLDQLPKRIDREGRVFELSPRPIQCSDTLESVLFVVRDVTEVIERKRAELRAREEQAVITAAVHDREALCRSLVECTGLIDALRKRPDRATTKRLLHTLKGNSAVLGFSSVAELCHGLEDVLNSDPERYDAPGALDELVKAWNGVERIVRRLVPDLNDARIELTEEEFQGFIERLQQANVPQSMLEMARSFRLTPTKRIFDTMSKSIERLAHRAAKQVTVETETHRVRISVGYFSSLLSCFIHLFRNSVDHGIESPEERLQVGKAETGKILLSSEINDGLLTLTVSDDGKGIDWSAVEQKAKTLGLPRGSREALTEALFSEGFSTARAVTALSGRGVGLGAVKSAVEQIDGRVSIDSTPGLGTTFRFEIPIHVGSSMDEPPCFARSPTCRPAIARLRDDGPVIAADR
jgi:two-component system chemotaxis sensor kinase CheA